MSSPTHGAPAGAAAGPRLRRTARREQLLAAATRAFARSGFAATSLDEVAAEAGISRVILYRHFESKADLYRAVLDRACARLIVAVGAWADYTLQTMDALLGAAVEDPDGFRLLFQHAAREPEFKAEIDRIRASGVDIARHHLTQLIPDQFWAVWAAHLMPTVAIDAVIAWLDAGQPNRDVAAERIGQVLAAIIAAAQEAP